MRVTNEGDDLLRLQAPDAIQVLAQVLAPEQLHDQEGHVRLLVDARVRDLDDEIALEPGGHPRLAPESLPHLRALHHIGEHDLQGMMPLGLDVHHLVDRPHAAHRNAPDDPIA
jgi:hypothetical protein